MKIPTIDELKKALHLGERIEALQHELASLFKQAGTKFLNIATMGTKTATKGIESINLPRKKHKFSKAARAKMAASRKARWAKIRAGKSESNPAAAIKEKPVKKMKRKMSAAARASIAEAQKARWAKIKAEEKA